MLMEFENPNIMSDEEITAIFGDSDIDIDKEKSSQELPIEENLDENNQNKKSAEEKFKEINPEKIFGDEETPESVGSEEDIQGKKGDVSSNESNPHVFTSLAKALKEEGILLDLADEEIDKVKTAEDFSELMEKTIQAKFDERQKRIDEALNNGVDPNVIQQYENTIHNLDSITAEQLEAEDENGDNLRKNILYRDYLNKGFTEERAKRAVLQAVKDGTDIEDAKEALDSIKEIVRSQYQSKLDEMKTHEDEVKRQQIEQAKALRKGLLEDKELLGDLEVDKAMRQRALDAIVKPIYQDPETGQQYTAIQLYEKENRIDFLKKIGLIYAMTDGFKNLDGLVGKKVKKEVGKGMRDLENTLNGTQRKGDGSLNFAAGTSDDPNSFLNLHLDV